MHIFFLHNILYANRKIYYIVIILTVKTTKRDGWSSRCCMQNREKKDVNPKELHGKINHITVGIIYRLSDC